MAETEITQEPKTRKGFLRGLFRRREQPQREEKEEIDRGQALGNFINRLRSSGDRHVQHFGKWLEEEYEDLVANYKEEKATNPTLSTREFLEEEYERKLFGRYALGGRLIPGPGWEIDDRYDKSRIMEEGYRGFKIDTIFAILGEPRRPVEERFGRFKEPPRLNHDIGFTFAVKGGSGYTRFEGMFANLKGEDERGFGIKLWIRREEGGRTADFFMHKGAICGWALEVPRETEAAYLGNKSK